MSTWKWLRNSGKIEELEEYVEHLEEIIGSKEREIDILQEKLESQKIRLFSGNFKRITTGEKVHFYSVFTDGKTYYALGKDGFKMYETTSFEELLYWKKGLTMHTLLNDRLPTFNELETIDEKEVSG